MNCEVPKFEAFNDKGNRIFYTFQESCIPSKSEIESMYKSGWKFKMDGKNISKTKLIEIITKG